MSTERILDARPLRVLSLFAGIGGIDLGLEAHGCTTVAYSEIDPYAASVMARHFPDAVNLGDITTIDWNEANEQHGPFDIICGGFPCQDISLAGVGRGIVEGSRSGLWRQYADAIRILRPRGVLVENVAALLARGIDRVLSDLAACGFDAEWDCVPAAAVGAPHRRDRLFIVAYPNGQGEHDGAVDAEMGITPQPVADPQGDHEPHEPRLDHAGRALERSGSGASSRALPRHSSPRSDEPGRDQEPGRKIPLADADGERGGARGSRRAPTQGQGWSSAWPTPERGDQWLIEPDVGRVADGVPNRMDRLKCLGNAVVPQAAEHVAGILINRMEQAA